MTIRNQPDLTSYDRPANCYLPIANCFLKADLSRKLQHAANIALSIHISR
jgi:hypothetical protein